MLLSISRRTDIPAYYSEWFFKRLHEGFCYVQNPINRSQIQKIIINPQLVDAMIFWTKNPKAMLPRLNELEQYPYYFQITLTSYAQDIESNLPQKKHIINSFKALSEKIGKNRVIWRYDPILLNEKYTMDYHIKYFEILAKNLSEHTEKVIISFIDYYKKIDKHWKKLGMRLINNEEKTTIAKAFSEIANSYAIKIESCCEELNLENYAITRSKCIDERLLSEISKYNLNIPKDKGQRLRCGCVQSVDIGMYNSCLHGCRYCYASCSDLSIQNNVKKHDLDSPLLIGYPPQDRVIKDKIQKSYKNNTYISLL